MTNSLPDTGAQVLLYDGDCGFCSRSVSWLERHKLLGVPARTWQSRPDDELPVPIERLEHEVVLAGGSGPILGGADALAAVVRRSNSPWRFIGSALALPPVRPVARLVYRAVARNRYRMPGGSTACQIR